jgi:hypothetical protein
MVPPSAGYLCSKQWRWFPLLQPLPLPGAVQPTSDRVVSPMTPCSVSDAEVQPEQSFGLLNWVPFGWTRVQTRLLEPAGELPSSATSSGTAMVPSVRGRRRDHSDDRNQEGRRSQLHRAHLMDKLRCCGLVLDLNTSG